MIVDCVIGCVVICVVVLDDEQNKLAIAEWKSTLLLIYPQSLPAVCSCCSIRCLYWASSFTSLRFGGAFLVLVRVLYHRRFSAAPAWHTLPLAGCSLSLLLWSAPRHAVPRVPFLNSTQSISFDAGLSLCYSVRGHAIDICPSVRPLAMSGFPPLILTSPRKPCRLLFVCVHANRTWLCIFE